MTKTSSNLFGPLLTTAIWFGAFAWVMVKFA